MIQELSVTYSTTNSDVIYKAQCLLDNDNAPYTLADLFAELIRKSAVNEDKVIEQLIYEFNYKKDEQT